MNIQLISSSLSFPSSLSSSPSSSSSSSSFSSSSLSSSSSSSSSGTSLQLTLSNVHVLPSDTGDSSSGEFMKGKIIRITPLASSNKISSTRADIIYSIIDNFKRVPGERADRVIPRSVDAQIASFLPFRTLFLFAKINKTFRDALVNLILPQLPYLTELTPRRLFDLSHRLARRELEIAQQELEKKKNSELSLSLELSSSPTPPILSPFPELLRQKSHEIVRRCVRLSSFKIPEREGGKEITSIYLKECLLALAMGRPNLKHIECQLEIGRDAPLKLTDEMIDIMGSFTQLETLCIHIKLNNKIPVDPKVHVNHYKILHSDFNGGALLGNLSSEKLINAIKHWTCLTKFGLSINSVVDVELFGRTGSNLHELYKEESTIYLALGKHCHRLRCLNLNGIHASDEGIQAIVEGCPDMTKMEFGHMTHVTEKGLKIIKNWRTLTDLQFGEGFIMNPPEEGFGSSLERVHFWVRQRLMTNIGPFLTASPNLKELSIWDGDLEEDIEGLSALVHCPLLERLTLSNCDLRNNAVERLISMKPTLTLLRYLDVGDNKISPGAYERLKQSWPGIEIAPRLDECESDSDRDDD